VEVLLSILSNRILEFPHRRMCTPRLLPKHSRIKLTRAVICQGFKASLRPAVCTNTYSLIAGQGGIFWSTLYVTAPRRRTHPLRSPHLGMRNRPPNRIGSTVRTALVSDSFCPSALPINRLRADRLLANHRFLFEGRFRMSVTPKLTDAVNLRAHVTYQRGTSCCTSST
jgi:hypothetical protein